MRVFGQDRMGPEASAANKALVGGKTVYLEKDISETDKYGRLLRYVFLPDGTFVNAELVRQGYAVSSTYPPDVKYQDVFRRTEQEARETEQGLWGPTPTLAPATPTPMPQATAAPTQPAPTQPPPAPAGKIIISYIYYDGRVRQVESDEYVEITNTGSAAVNLKGWRLNADDPGQDFWFPDFVIQPGQSCRVYTNEYHPEHCGFSFGRGKALWNNSDRECGHLYNASGVEVSTKCY